MASFLVYILWPWLGRVQQWFIDKRSEIRHR